MVPVPGGESLCDLRHEIECESCGGTGKGGRRSAGLVCGSLVGKEVVCGGLVGPLAESNCRVWDGVVYDDKKLGNGHGLFLAGRLPDGTDWRVVVMGLRIDNPISEYDPLGTRTPPTYVPGVGALTHLLGTPCEYALADWLMDRGLNIDTVFPKENR